MKSQCLAVKSSGLRFRPSSGRMTPLRYRQAHGARSASRACIPMRPRIACSASARARRPRRSGPHCAPSRRSRPPSPFCSRVAYASSSPGARRPRRSRGPRASADGTAPIPSRSSCTTLGPSPEAGEAAARVSRRPGRLGPLSGRGGQPQAGPAPRPAERPRGSAAGRAGP